MIFAKYKGPMAAGENLTLGKIYVGLPEMEDDDTVDFGFFTIVDDTGGTIKTTVAEGKCDYLQSVYAVLVSDTVAKAQGARLGEVVVVEAISGDHEFVRLAGDGCWKLDNFEILDKTNLYPDMVVLDKWSGEWVRVVMVNESMHISTVGAFRPPTEFRFAVSGGSVLSRPCVVCFSDSGQALTRGNHYCLTKTSDGAVTFYMVINDDGKEVEYLADRFKFV